LARTAIATGAAAAVVLAAAPAFAANVPLTLSTTNGVTGGGETITATGPGFLTGITAPATVFSTAATCPQAFPTGAGNIPAATTKTSDGTATITVPAGVLAPTTYRVCVYNGTLSTSAIAGNAAGFIATPAAPTVSPSAGPGGGGNQITLTASTGYLAGGAALTALFSTAACTPTFGTPAAGSAVPVAKNASNTVATVTVPGSVTAPNAYNVCVYAGTGVDSPLIGVGAGPYAVIPPMVTLNPSSGMAGSGGMITATSTVNFLNGVMTPAAVFAPVSTGCLTSYPTGSGLPAGGVTRIADNQLSLMVPPGVTGPGAYNVCFYSGTGPTNMLIGVTGTPYTLSFPPVTLSARVGPTGGLNTITASSNAPFLNSVTTPGAVFTTATTCPGTYPPGSTAANMTGTALRVSPTKAAITVPVGLANGNQYSVCIYAGTEPNSGLIASSPKGYTVAAPTTITNVSPGSGPAMGGTRITVSGSGFPTEPGSITATVGGAPLMSIMPMSPGQFTAVMPAHAQGVNLPFKVTTAAGTFTWAPGFTYSNGIVISPNTASDKESVFVDILGVDFSSIDFTTTTGNTSTDAKGHIYLVDLDAGQMYDPGEDGASIKETPPAAECTNVLVVSDDEVICRLTLTGSLTADGTPDPGTPVLDGAYNLTVVSDGQIGAENYTTTNVSSGSTFTVADY
jgi:hypothetical protein